MARLRSAPSTQQPASKAKATATGRPALREKTNTARTTGPMYDDDGNTDGLVKNVKAKRGRPRKSQQDSDELVMAGGLGIPTSEDTQPHGDISANTHELAKSDSQPTAATKQNKRPARTVKKVTQSEAQSKVLEGLKQRMRDTAKVQKGEHNPASKTLDVAAAPPSDNVDHSRRASQNAKPATAERSEFSLSPSPPAPAKLSAVNSKRTSTVAPGSALRVQGTPAIESSILALKNFKRRPRQPSMLQMVQQRTASARPSIANTAIETTAVDDSSGFDLDIETDEEDDFAPEAEGTPLHARKAKRQSTASWKTLPVERVTSSRTLLSRKRKSDDLDVSSSSLGRLQAKRRKSTAVEDEQQEEVPLPAGPVEVEAVASQSPSERPETPQPPITSDVQVANSPSTSTSTPPTEPPSTQPRSVGIEDDFIVPSTERYDDEPEHDNDVANGTMADPLSSSPLRESASQMNHLAYPATQVSPVATKTRPKRKVKPLSTAMLQSLLPRKRAPLKPRTRKSEYDFESDEDEDAPLDASHLDEDEDELGGRLRKQTRPVPSKPAKRGRSSKSSIAARQTSTAQGRKSSTAPGAKKGPRTYGRASTSDKENEGYESQEQDDENEESTLPDISVSMEEVAKSKEIEEAKRKFADIDKWDMQFETVSVEEHRSSSQDWL